jgi:hypothetical protein
MQRGSLTSRTALGWIKLVIFSYICICALLELQFLRFCFRNIEYEAYKILSRNSLWTCILICFYQECHSSPGSSLVDWFFKNCLFIFGLLDIILHNWIIETCVYPFCSELKSGSPDCFAIADTTYTNGERLQI